MQAGLSQALLRPHQEDIQDWIWVLSFHLIKVYKCQIILPPGPGQTQQQLGQGFMLIIPELEERYHLPNKQNSAPAAVTELPLSSGVSMTSEPGLSNISQHMEYVS